MNQTPHNLKNQEGVTLLVSVLILSGMAVITASVAFFAIQEIRASRAILYTEPAISAAQGGGEIGIWQVKRNKTLSTCTSPSNPSIDTAHVDLCTSYGPATFDLNNGEDYVFFLYDPNNPSTSDLGSYYTSLTVTNHTTTQLVVEVRRIDSDSIIGSRVLAPGTTGSVNNLAASPGQEGRMQVTLKPTSSGTAVVTTNQGMPGFPTIDSSACVGPVASQSCTSSNETFKRRINITVPK